MNKIDSESRLLRQQNIEKRTQLLNNNFARILWRHRSHQIPPTTLRECIFITELCRKMAILPRQQLWLSTNKVKHSQLEINTLCLQRVTPILWTSRKVRKAFGRFFDGPKTKIREAQNYYYLFYHLTKVINYYEKIKL